MRAKRWQEASLAAFIPTAVIGLAAADYVKDNLYGLWPVAAAWIAGGICILIIDRQNILTGLARDSKS